MALSRPQYLNKRKHMGLSKNWRDVLIYTIVPAIGLASIGLGIFFYRKGFKIGIMLAALGTLSIIFWAIIFITYLRIMSYRKIRPLQAAPVGQSPFLSDELNRTMQKAEEAEQINITELAKGTLIEVVTLNTRYVVMVADPQNRWVVLASNSISPDMKGPHVALLLGSSYGGSTLKLGHIVVEGYMEVHIRERRPTKTSEVKKFQVINEPELARGLLDFWEKNRPKGLKG